GAVADAAAEGGVRDEPADAGALAGVVAGGVCRERVLEGDEGGVLAAGRRSHPAAVAAGTLPRRRGGPARRADALAGPAVDAGRVHPGWTSMRESPTKKPTRRGG